MDVCPAFDSHNDLPWTYVKYQDGQAPTQTNVGVEMDKPISNQLLIPSMIISM